MRMSPRSLPPPRNDKTCVLLSNPRYARLKLRIFSSVTNTIENARRSTPSSGTRDARKPRSFPLSTVCLRCLLMTRKYSLARGSILSELQRLLASGALYAIGLVRSDDPLHECMADNVSLIEVYERNPLDAGNHISRFDQARHFSNREIDLRNVTCNHSFAVISDACKEHFHLLGRGVLSLVQNHK